MSPSKKMGRKTTTTTAKISDQLENPVTAAIYSSQKLLAFRKKAEPDSKYTLKEGKLSPVFLWNTVNAQCSLYFTLLYFTLEAI